MKTAQLVCTLTLVFAATFSVASHAEEKPTVTEASDSAMDMTDGEVRKVNKDTQKITIKHGEIKNLDMPGMTMVFQVKDAAMLDRVKAGDKIKFVVEKLNGSMVVTAMKSSK